MKPITFSMLTCSNKYTQAIIAKAYEPGYNKGGDILQTEKIRIPGQEKGGKL